MTAEVAVMNKSAVALAADSAMTVTVGEARKTYPTNKLFALSKHHPIGIMIYNNAQFMDVPWETIVKMYRKQLGTSSRRTVQKYVEDFLGYIGNAAICTDEQRQSNLLRISNDLFVQIMKDVHATINDSRGGSPDVPAVIRAVVTEHMDALAHASEAPSMQDCDATALIRTHEDHVNALIDQCLYDDLDDLVRQQLLEVLAVAIKSSRLTRDFSGLVFAGFGENEIFPSLVEIVTDGMIGNIIKADSRRALDLARSGTHTAILPFAQSEMVERFMEGIDSDLMQYLGAYIANLLTSVYGEVLEPASPQPPTEHELSQLQEIVEDKVNQFRSDTASLCRTAFVNPVLEIVSQLPKEELASLAESLVSLTSLKRRVSTEEESVGGPVDVAVVSKGDGFIWIKRKHYFEPSLNRDYFDRQSPAAQETQGDQHAL